MTLPPYPGQSQPEEPKEPAAPQPPVTPPPPPAPPATPPGPPAAQPPAPTYPGGSTPPPAPPGGFPPPPAPGAFPPPMPPAYQAYAGPNDGGTGYSATAIASFVCSLTCCLAVPAVILGIIGIVRTGAGKARGRWMAVTGLVLGVLGTLAMLLAGFALSQVEGWDDVAMMSPGTCFDSNAATNGDDDSIGLVDEVPCTGTHDAEVIARWTVASQAEADRLERNDPWTTCLEHVRPGLAASLERDTDRDLSITFVSWDPTDISPGDDITCYVYRDGGTLTGPLLSEGTAS